MDKLKVGVRGTYKENCHVCHRPKPPNYCQCPEEPKATRPPLDGVLERFDKEFPVSMDYTHAEIRGFLKREMGV